MNIVISDNLDDLRFDISTIETLLRAYESFVYFRDYDDYALYFSDMEILSTLLNEKIKYLKFKFEKLESELCKAN